MPTPVAFGSAGSSGKTSRRTIGRPTMASRRGHCCAQVGIARGDDAELRGWAQGEVEPWTGGEQELEVGGRVRKRRRVHDLAGHPLFCGHETIGAGADPAREES